MARHFTWYNTEPIAGSLIFGIILGMEEQRALHHNVDAEMITSIKSSLMGPVAGIGDSLVQATLIPILCTMTISISGESGSVMGPLFYIVALLAIILSFGYVLLFGATAPARPPSTCLETPASAILQKRWLFLA